MYLGPSAAVVVMTAILVVQALVFQDGGLLALGANVVNMAVIGVWAGYLPAKWLSRRAGWRKGATFVAGWLSLMAGALFASIELWFSDVAPAVPLFASMLGIHALTGVAEGAITAASLAAIERLNPEFVYALGGNGSQGVTEAAPSTAEPLARQAAASGQ